MHVVHKKYQWIIRLYYCVSPYLHVDTYLYFFGSFVYPDWFQCEFGSSFLPQCVSGTGSREPTNLNFHMKNILYVGTLAKIIPTYSYKILHEGFGIQVYLIIFAYFLNCSWIPISIPNTDLDPDPGESNHQWGSIRIRIHNTAFWEECSFMYSF